jgi:hypothetical protein
MNFGSIYGGGIIFPNFLRKNMLNRDKKIEILPLLVL